MISKKEYLFSILFIQMTSVFLPLLFNNLPPIINSRLLWILIWFTSLLIFFPKIFLNKAIIYLILYGIFIYTGTNTFWDKIDTWNRQMLFEEFFHISLGVSIITYFNISKDYKGLAKLTKWAILFLLITSIMTIILAINNPLYARKLTGIANISNIHEKEYLLSLNRFGAGNYSTAISTMSILPLLIFLFKNNNLNAFKKSHTVLFIIIMTFALFNMQIFANIILAIFFSLTAFFGMKKIKHSIIISLCLLILMFIIPKSFYIEKTRASSNLFDKESDLHYKLNDIANFIELGAKIDDTSTGTGGRAERFVQLFDSFIQSPFWGCFLDPSNKSYGYFSNFYDYGKIGQVEGTHLHWMNKLTITGIFGFTIFIYIIYYQIKINIHRVQSYGKFYFLLAIMCFFIYGIFKTIVGREAWYTFFVIVPGIFYFPLLKKQQ